MSDSGSVFSILSSGFTGFLVRVECRLSNNLPTIVIVGLGNKSVDESKERLRSAFASSSLSLPKKKITLNLAPADVPKEGSAFDLAMAAAILKGTGKVARDPDKSDTGTEVYLGELGLDGSVRPVRGIIGKILSAKKLGFSTFIVPEANIAQAQLVDGTHLYPVKNIDELYRYMTSPSAFPMVEGGQRVKTSRQSLPSAVDMSDVVGQTRAKRALEIASAGYHNILLNGPPGTGKSMLAKALISIMTPPSRSEMLEITHLHSLASKAVEELQQDRPFRAPHHSASDIAIIGGGANPRPGEITLAHRGVLFFDELPEFSRKCIESLRQPLEDHSICISRAKDTVSYPANFLFIATANPCPCGYYGSGHECSCSPLTISNYQKKLSGPILDRIDLHITVEEISHSSLMNTNTRVTGESSKSVLTRVINAQKRQLERSARLSIPEHRNSEWSNRTIKLHANLAQSAETVLNSAADRLGLSARGYMKTIKVARTIADLDSSESITETHIAEALQYRPQKVQSI